MSDIRIATPEDQILLEKEAKYCSYGDTVHYIEPPRIFSRCEGSYVWDTEDQAYLDLQMWYSAVNFGYANPRLKLWETSGTGATRRSVTAISPSRRR